MGQASCRIPPALDGVLDAAADETGLFRSDMMRRAVAFYAVANPDELEALGEDTSLGLQLMSDPLSGAYQTPSSPSASSASDGTKTGETEEKAEAGRARNRRESSGESATEDSAGEDPSTEDPAMGGPVYDPSKDET